MHRLSLLILSRGQDRSGVQAAGYAAVLLMFAGVSLETQPFIYFQF